MRKRSEDINCKIGDVLYMCKYIYNDKGDCYLRRKYNNFLKVFHDDTEVNSWIAKGQESP